MVESETVQTSDCPYCEKERFEERIIMDRIFLFCNNCSTAIGPLDYIKDIEELQIPSCWMESL